MIAVLGQPFGGDELLARYLAARYGLDCVEPQVIVEKAAALGAPHAELWQALSKPPRLLGRLGKRRRTLLTLLEFALAEEIRPGQAVCYGSLAELLPRETPYAVLRIRVHAPSEFRVSRMRERLKLTETEALERITRMDRDQRNWIRYVHGFDSPDKTARDLVADLEGVALEDAFEKVIQAAGDRLRFSPEDPLLPAWSDHVLSCRVKAALALAPSTGQLEIDVVSEGGCFQLYGRLPWTVDLHEVERVARKVPGVKDIGVGGLKPASSGEMPAVAVIPGQPSRLKLARKLAKPWDPQFAAGLALCLVILFTLAFRNSTNPAVDRIATQLGNAERVFVGYVTDTLCKDAAGMEPECILTCVGRFPSVQYALHDGDNLYTLSDQSTPGRYAAQLVHVIGSLNSTRSAIQVTSIHPVS